MFKIEPFGKDAIHYLKESNAFINIADGSVRSGKTIATCFRFLQSIADSPNTTHMICGKSWTSVKRNVISPLMEIMDTFNIEYTFKRADQELVIEENNVYVMGLNNEASTDVIAGLTLSKVFLDEASRVPQSAFEMLVSRLSMSDSQLFCTTNPDSPFHWLFTNYLNNEELLNEGVVKHFKFLLDNNPSLPESYIKQIKLANKHSDVFYKRNIEGEWVVAEGRIFDSFDPNKHVIKPNEVPKNIPKLVIGTDYGLSSPTAFVADAQQPNQTGDVHYILETEYHDPSLTHHQKSDREKAVDLKKLCDKVGSKEYRRSVCYVPHDAGSLLNEINKHSNVPLKARTYTPNTLECIYELQNLFDKDKILIVDNKSNQQLIKDLQNYSWDSKKQQKGIDYPLEINDHSIDAMRLSILADRKGRRKIII